MTEDRAHGADRASVKAFPPPQSERGTWHTITRIEKYHDGREPDGHPDDVVEVEGNLLCNAGIAVMLDLLAVDGAAGTGYTNGVLAHLAVGSGVTGADPTDTTIETQWEDYHTASATVTNQSVAFSATFANGHATGAWNEVGVFNAAVAGAMLNHVVSALGTKDIAATWVLTITITIS